MSCGGCECNVTVTGGAVATTFADPTAAVGLTAVNGTALTAMRSDGAPPLSQAIVPTWTGAHTFRKQIVYNDASATVVATPSGPFVNIPDYSNSFAINPTPNILTEQDVWRTTIVAHFKTGGAVKSLDLWIGTAGGPDGVILFSMPSAAYVGDCWIDLYLSRTGNDLRSVVRFVGDLGVAVTPIVSSVLTAGFFPNANTLRGLCAAGVADGETGFNVTMFEFARMTP